MAYLRGFEAPIEKFRLGFMISARGSPSVVMEVSTVSLDMVFDLTEALVSSLGTAKYQL